LLSSIRIGCGNAGMRWRIDSWICGLFFVAACVPSAPAQTDYTYVFTANPGQVTWYNGTTFEISVSPGPPGLLPPPDEYFNLMSINFNAVLDLPATAGDPPYYGPSPASLTPFSFSPSGPDLGEVTVEISAANASGWAGFFFGYGGGGLPGQPGPGQYAVYSDGVVWGPGDGGTSQPVIVEAATGTWSLVPDAGSSFELLATAMAALGADRLFLRGRRDYGKS
jgi:hypothetical protein